MTVQHVLSPVRSTKFALRNERSVTFLHSLDASAKWNVGDDSKETNCHH